MAAKPNILFLIADDHRHSAVRAFGDPVVRTPVLDGLAARGVAFPHTYIMGGLSPAVCVPSRAALHTGVNIFKSGHQDLNPDLALLPETFRRAGYRTFAVGKWHNDRRAFARSFCDGACLFFGGMSDHRSVPIHDFDPDGAYPKAAARPGEKFSTELFADAAVGFLRALDGNDPFFLYLAFTAPHDPRTAPKDYADLYPPESIPLPDNFLSDHPFDNGELRIRDEELAPHPRTPETVRRHIADYYAMITHLDAHIGRVLQALDETGRAENTLVVYTADHGLAVGRHGLLGKQNLYDHSVRVPLILAGPALPRGVRIDPLVSPLDLFPTLCGLADLPVPETVEGESLLPLLAGKTGRIRDHTFAVYKDLQRMACDGRWKFLRYYRSDAENAGTDRIQLFDLETDPAEMRDRSDDPACRERLHALADALADWQRRVGDPLSGRPVLPRRPSSGTRP